MTTRNAPRPTTRSETLKPITATPRLVRRKAESCAVVRSGFGTGLPLASVAASVLSLVQARTGWSLAFFAASVSSVVVLIGLPFVVRRGQRHVLGRAAVRGHVRALGQHVVALGQEVLADAPRTGIRRGRQRVLEDRLGLGVCLGRRVDHLTAERRSVRGDRDVLLDDRVAHVVVGVAALDDHVTAAHDERDAQHDRRDPHPVPRQPCESSLTYSFFLSFRALWLVVLVSDITVDARERTGIRANGPYWAGRNRPVLGGPFGTVGRT